MISWKIIEGLYSYQSIPLPINRISEFVDILLTLFTIIPILPSVPMEIAKRTHYNLKHHFHNFLVYFIIHF